MRIFYFQRARGPFSAGRLAVLALCCLLWLPASAAGAGAHEAKKPGAQRSETAETDKRASRAAEKVERDVYEQPPFTEKELVGFMEKLPFFLSWVRGSKAAIHPIVNEAGRPDFLYTAAAAAKARDLGWEPARFFCLLGRTAAALYLVEEGTDLTDKLPKDMPFVTPGETALVRRHLASLLRAGAGGPPPAMAR